MRACGFLSYYSEAMIIHIFMHIICTHTKVQDSSTKEIDQRLLCWRGFQEMDWLANNIVDVLKRILEEINNWLAQIVVLKRGLQEIEFD
jgi:hypothetical protein